MLQLPAGNEFDIPQPDTLLTVSSVQNLGSAENAAMLSRPEIKNGELGVQIAHLGLLGAKALYKPTLSFGGSVSTGYSNDHSTAYFKQIDRKDVG